MSDQLRFRQAATTFTERGGPPREVPLRAPYSMVPTGDRVLLAPCEPRHDRPVDTAISGHLAYRLTSETPVLVGGAGDANDTPARTPDGSWIIPGSSIRGMIRAVLECVAFARLNFVDDCAAATRDFKDPTWTSEVAPNQHMRLGGGWLFITPEGFKLVAASDVQRVHFNDVLTWVGGMAEADWHNANMHERLTRLLGTGRYGIVDATVFGHPNRRAQCVVAGQTASEDQVDQLNRVPPKHRKQHEHLFFWPNDLPSNIYPINQRLVERFVLAQHRDSNVHIGDPGANFTALTQSGRASEFAENWDSWRKGQKGRIPAFDEQLARPNAFSIPVFWHNPKDPRKAKQSEPSRNVVILSLTPFLRYTYGNGLKEIIARYPQVDGTAYDLAQAIFGWAPQHGAASNPHSRNPQERSLKSRVRFGFATSEQGDEQLEAQTRRWAATQPRASFWPYYLKPRGAAKHPVDYNNPAAVVAGRKRYPARNQAMRLPRVHANAANAQTQGREDRMETTLRFLKAGTVFEGEIRVHNLTEIEMGALLWALTFGSPQEDIGHRHMLGRARPWGFGQLKLEIKGDETSLERVVSGERASFATCIEAFENWLRESLDVGHVDEIETLRRLRGIAHAPTGAQLLDRLKFPAIGNTDDAEAILKGHTGVKAAAKQRGLQGKPAPDRAGEPDFVGLPGYPGASDG
ncbi:TIGR03986 family CRISPR-associated RAMP protein [Paralimibaculum aggregatum]|uniref:TIGR03986 family CRISPR-associated RAMP protein n=1 Tax=Paralimibaculum aggregatum TaxID=3036245 RepID=A0ABQ6LTG3_9RHOB|nr:TIGR03986 family CRISPR-associated RAMP protein [Limibaculum sp. NKW23]GMG85348.1 TIGR03986 family CRISPR-associated RAMP protein [Limibaculum sp. NKW23]